MGIFDFWKRGKLNRLLSKLKEDFQEEIKDFGHFKELQTKKVDIIKKIKKIWNESWTEAEQLVKNSIPLLIRRQLEFIKIDIKYVDEEDSILQYFIKIEERRNTILGHYINQNINPDYLEAVRNQGKRNIAKINEAIWENSTALKEECLAALEENLNKQLRFFERNDSWSAINQNQEFLVELNKEQELTQKVENIVKDIIIKIKEIAGFELRQTLMTRRRFVGYSAAGLIWAFLSEGKTAQAEKLIEKSVMPNKDLKEGEPKINIRIFYGSHDTTEDAIAISEEFQNADIYIPERTNWTQESLALLRDLSAGKITVEQYINLHYDVDPFKVQESKMIYNSRKYIALIDVPKGYQFYKNKSESVSPYIDYIESFEDTLLLYSKYYQEYAAIIKERENFILSQLQEFIKALRQNIRKNSRIFPKTVIKRGIRILIFLGAAHTRFSKYAQRKFPKSVSRKFAKKPYFFDIQHEVLRRNIFGKEVSKEILAAMLFEEIFVSTLSYNFIKVIAGNTEKLFIFLRSVAAKFSFDEIKKIYEAIKESGDRYSWELLKARKLNVINKALSQKGIRLPQTPEEFTNMLPRYAK